MTLGWGTPWVIPDAVKIFRQSVCMMCASHAWRRIASCQSALFKWVDHAVGEAMQEGYEHRRWQALPGGT